MVVVNTCDCKIIFNADHKRTAVCISKCDNMIGQSLRVFSRTLTVIGLSFLFCIKIFQSKLHISSPLLIFQFVDIKLVLALLATKFISLPACDKGFFTMLAHTHITVLVCEHEGKTHLHHINSS